MAAKLTSKIRGAICSCSTGTLLPRQKGKRSPYYSYPGAFFRALEEVLEAGGYEYFDFQYPTIHTQEGDALLGVVDSSDGSWEDVPIDPLFEVAIQWHRMPSGRWEFTCYPAV